MSRPASAALAAVQTLAATTGSSEDEILKEMTSFFSSRATEEKTVTLDSPMSITVSVLGKYSRVPMIGGEEFSVVGCYMGKRDGVILLMLGEHEGQLKTFEMPAHVADQHLEGLDNLLAKFIGTYGMEDPDDLMGEGKRIEDEAHADAILQSRMSDQRFGSW